jgi:nitrite reductase/ring-hydroxylating ferredoxin subunit
MPMPRDLDLSVDVAKVTEIPVGAMKRVKAFNENILLSNVGGKIFATQNECGHQRASLSKGSLEGSIVTCPLHGAKFDVITGQNVGGVQMRYPPEIMQKLPAEMIEMFKKTGEIISDIEIEPLKTYRVNVVGDVVYIGRD